MSKNLIALQHRFLGEQKTAYQLLSALQQQQGHIDPQDIDRLANEHQLPPQLLRTTAEFYDQLTPRVSPGAVHQLQICNGEACQAAGADKLRKQLIKRFKDQPDTTLAIGEVTCLGYCSSAPNVSIDQQAVSAPGNDLGTLLERYLSDPTTALPLPENPCYPVTEGSATVLMPYLLSGDQTENQLYDQLKTVLAKNSPEQLLNQISLSQLRGRGGAGFPLATKLQTVRDSGNSSEENADNRKYLVVNFDEGDAGAFIDKELVERCPALLISAAIMAAYCCGASRIYIYARLEYPQARQLLTAAIDRANAQQLINTLLTDNDFSCDINIIEGQGAYICGEETSLLRSIEGLPATVSIRPPFPAQQGLWGRPTAVCNVETLCNLPWIIANGGAAYAALGYGDSRGTKLVSLNSRVKRPGLYEVEFGTTLREIIFELAGGMAGNETFKAVQIGGPLGGLLPESALDTPLSFEALPPVGGILGHGSMVIYSQRDNLADIARNVMAFCGRESCGKCFPCRIGSVRATELLDQIKVSGITPQRQELLTDICDTMKTGSLCAMGSMTPAAVETVLNHFPDEFNQPATPLSDIGAGQ